jgi:hypothetical protein
VYRTAGGGITTIEFLSSKDYVREMLTAPPVEKCCEPFKRANHVKRFVTVLRAKTS